MKNYKLLTIFLFLHLGLFQVSSQTLMSCNGMRDFCDLRLPQVTFAGTHNSGAGFDGILWYHTNLGVSFPALSCFYRNQGQSITEQLNNGIRYFDIDTCFVDSGPWEKGAWTCHNGSWGGPVYKMLKQMDDWMNQHRNEVIVVHFNRDTIKEDSKRTGENVIQQLANLWEPSEARKRFKSLMMNDKRRSSWKWPTLGEAVKTNQRIFVFMNNQLVTSDQYYTRRWIHMSNFEIGLTWKTMNLVKSKGCSKLVDYIKYKCSHSGYYHYIEVDLFLSWGLCIKHLANVCNKKVTQATEKCYEERKRTAGATVNFVSVDWAGRTKGQERIKEVVKSQNMKNVRFFLHREARL